MGKKCPGILNMYKFGNLERKNTEFYKLMDVTKSRTLILNLLFYIQAAALKFGEEVEIALSALKVKAYNSYTKPAVLSPKLEEFEQVYQKWLKQGGIPTINISSGNNKNISNQNNHNNKEIMNFMEVPVSVSDENLSLTSSKHTPNKMRKWDINLGDNEPKIYEEAEPKIPNIRQIRHRFAKGKFGRGREPKAQIGKTKYDIMEERWAIVILYKYLVITPAELCCILSLQHRKIWHSLELYENYGPRGLVEDVWTEQMSDKYLKKYGEEIKEFAQKELKEGKTLSLKTVINHISGNRGGKKAGISKSMIGEVFRKLGYSYCQSRVIYKEKHKTRVVEMRHDYIREFYKNRESMEGIREIYIDEAFVRDFQQLRHLWMTEEIFKTREVPAASVYNEIAIVGGISKEGWVGVDYPNLRDKLRESNQNYTFSHGSILYFKTLNPDRRDPHTCFTTKSFGNYFRHNLIPSITDQSSLIIMDRALYHTKVTDSQLNMKKARKEELLEYLMGKGIFLDLAKSSTQQLRAMAIKVGPNLRSYIENEAQQAGHKILFTPPYHPELNPIEMAWSMVKKPIRERNKPDTNFICTEILPNRFPLVTPLVANKLCVDTVLAKFRDEMNNNIDIIKQFKDEE